MTQAPVGAMVTVRDVRGADELRACQDLQRKAWGITEDGYVVPVATMASAQRVGGLILGAFDPNQLLIGFAFAFLGKLRDRLVLWSQLTGVHPAHQSTGVGRMLKLEQRHRARDMRLEAVAWAFDPMQASNAAFNLAVLGATAQLYEHDMYGARTDTLNIGLATDRLLVEWSTSGPTGGRTLAWDDTADLIETSSDPSRTYRRATTVRDAPSGSRHLSIEVPANLLNVKNGPPEVAREWQTALRQAFGSAFSAGYLAVGFTRQDPSHPKYLLERAE